MIDPTPGCVLVAPDSFKGTFTAAEVARVVGAGLNTQGQVADVCPVADGGEGTLDALVLALGGEITTVPAHGPLGDTIQARVGFIDGGATAVIETAAASGLGLVAPQRRDASAASTVGTGELVAAAVLRGAQTVLLGVGGSATTDGGAGAIAAIQLAGGLGPTRLIVLCDVRTPYEDAARVFGPQKGAGATEVDRLTARLHSQARDLPRDPRGIAMTGAAGGLSGGLWATFGAELVPGASFVLDAVGFDARLNAARAVVTGEGRIDQQSLAGKLVSEIAVRADQRDVPCYAVCGECDLDAAQLANLGLKRVFEASTARQLESAGRRLAELA